MCEPTSSIWPLSQMEALKVGALRLESGGTKWVLEEEGGKRRANERQQSVCETSCELAAALFA